MKIKQKLFTSFTIVTVAICFSVIILNIVLSENNLNQNLKFSNDVLQSLSDNFQNISENSLTEYTKKYLKIRTSNLFYTLTPLIKKDQYNLEIIKKDRIIKNLINKPLKIGNNEVGYFVLLNGAESVIIGPRKIVQFSESFYKEIFFKINELNNECLKKGYTDGYYNYIDKDGDKVVKKYAVLYKIPNSNIIVAGLLNLYDYYKTANKNIDRLKNDFFEKQRKTLISYYNKSVLNKTLLFILCIFIAVILNIILISLIMNFLTNPIIRLTRKLKEFDPNNPDFTIQIPKSSCTEVAEITQAFSEQEKELKKYMNNFKKELETRHLLEHELEVAKKIQNSVLPKITAEFQRPEFSLFAKLISAKEVAGDFFDFFYLDEDRMALLIADVSGKGIPAALFMQRAKIILRASCETEDQCPGKALAKANHTLSKRNEACMFVTVFLIYYNIKTGELKYANGGHHPTVKADSVKIEEFGKLKDVALGTFDDVEFKTATEIIEPGKTLIFFTDGVIEAISPSFEEFGYSRFFKAIRESISDDVKKLGNSILDKVHNFEVKSQFDDITILILRRESK